MTPDPTPVTYYKATCPNGTDFRTGRIDYAAALVTGETVHHPLPGRMVPDDAATYLSVAVDPVGCLLGGSWPARLFEVVPVGDVLNGLSTSPYKRAVRELRVVRELPAHLTLGPQGQHVTALIDRAGRITTGEARQMVTRQLVARDAARDVAWGAARDVGRDVVWSVAWDAARDVAWDVAGTAAGVAAGPRVSPVRFAAWSVARDAVRALVVRDLLDPRHYRALTAPWAQVIGPAHPDDTQEQDRG